MFRKLNKYQKNKSSTYYLINFIKILIEPQDKHQFLNKKRFIKVDSRQTKVLSNTLKKYFFKCIKNL